MISLDGAELLAVRLKVPITVLGKDRRRNMGPSRIGNPELGTQI